VSDALNGLARCCAEGFKISSYNVDGRVSVYVTTMSHSPLHVKGVLLLFSWRIRVYWRDEPYGDCPQGTAGIMTSALSDFAIGIRSSTVQVHGAQVDAHMIFRSWPDLVGKSASKVRLLRMYCSQLPSDSHLDETMIEQPGCLSR
jgi:hypothetical protein